MIETKLADQKIMPEEELPFFLVFTLAMRSPATKQKYLQRFEYFMNFANVECHDGSIESRCNILAAKVRTNLNWFRNKIYKYLQHLKAKVDNKEISGATLRNYIKPIKLFSQLLEIDDNIHWNKILRGMPKGRRYANDRAPTEEEIRKLCKYPDRRMKAIICLNASSAIRLGGYDYLRWEHISPIIRDEK